MIESASLVTPIMQISLSFLSLCEKRQKRMEKKPRATSTNGEKRVHIWERIQWIHQKCECILKWSLINYVNVSSFQFDQKQHDFQLILTSTFMSDFAHISTYFIISNFNQGHTRKLKVGICVCVYI